jgi:hypothetical protein
MYYVHKMLNAILKIQLQDKECFSHFGNHHGIPKKEPTLTVKTRNCY